MQQFLQALTHQIFQTLFIKTAQLKHHQKQKKQPFQSPLHPFTIQLALICRKQSLKQHVKKHITFIKTNILNNNTITLKNAQGNRSFMDDRQGW